MEVENIDTLINIGVQMQMREAINSFAVFQFNYDHAFIEKAFATRPNLIEHFNRKFLEYYEKYGSRAAAISFYMELDIENKRLLADYIIKANYL